jgi:uncharacterized membrane protein
MIPNPPSAAPVPRPTLAVPAFPGTTNEFITVLAHYHRAEIARMAGWRDRIDRTTNWAITVVAAMLSVSLSTPTAHQGVLLFAMLLVMLLLRIEARRYRFFDVYRSRVRRLERNYYAQILSPRGGGGGGMGRHPGRGPSSPYLPDRPARSHVAPAEAQLRVAVPHPAPRMGHQDHLG